MLVGYQRVSTIDQNLDLQTDALRQYGCEKIYTDKISGSVKNRVALDACIKSLEMGDTMVVWRLDRLGRVSKDLISLVSDLSDKGINLISIKENIDTNTELGQIFFYICACLAEMERNLIIERTKAGLDAARARGRMGGRPKALTEEKQVALWEMYQSKNYSITTLREIFGLSKPTLYSYINEMKREHPRHPKECYLNE